MADQTPFPPARGDEAALFRDFNAELMRTVAGAVVTSSPQVVEDAVSHAWTRFMQYQPDREQNWQGRLFRVAQHEAWTLEAMERDHASLDEDGRYEGRSMWALPRAHDQHDPRVTHLEVGEAFEILDRLPERLRRVALLRALGMRHKDIGELTGDSPTRVGQLVSRANVRIYEVLEERARRQADLPPRAKRLAELEERPPTWLIEEIGRPPRMRRQRTGYPELRRSWRRAALALDDLRAARAGGGEPSALRQQAADAISELRQQRDRYLATYTALLCSLQLAAGQAIDAVAAEEWAARCSDPASEDPAVGERPLEIDLTIAYSHAEDGWLTAIVPALPGTITAGRSRHEARALVLDALATVLCTPDPERIAEADEIERVTCGSSSIARAIDSSGADPTARHADA